MAHRRQRQIGLLAATGATDRHLRLVMVANGVTVGVVAAVVGAAAGLLLWIGLAGAVEPAAGHRIDRFDVPWWVVVAGMALAVCAATAASWWPARAVARLPVTAALSARPAAPLPARRSTLLAGGLLGVGAAAITWSDPNRTTLDPQPFRDIVMVAGVVAIALGVLLLGPIVLRSVGRAARRLPVTGRLALRDLARFQARSGMALGAVSLAVGIPIAIVITAGAVEAGEDEGNLSDRDLVLRIGDTGGPMVEEAPAGDVDALAAQVQHVARDLDGAAVVELEMAMEPGSRPPPGFDVREAVAVGYPVGENTLRDVVAYVATPELLDHLGVDPGLAEGGADVLTVRTEPLFVISAEDRTDPEALTSARLDVPRHSSGPTTLITPEVVGRRGWDTVTAGWLVSAPSPLTGDQVREARDVAAAAGMTLEARNEGSSGSLRQGAIGAGSLLALAVVAMTVGLVRSEATGDLRTLAVTGATSTMRRRLTAWTAGALGLLGVVLGALGAYVGLASGFARELGALGDVPLGELAVIAAGVPLLAAGAGWALGGREPSSLTRPDG
jgi:putative ABC transport system permease protein